MQFRTLNIPCCGNYIVFQETTLAQESQLVYVVEHDHDAKKTRIPYYFSKGEWYQIRSIHLSDYGITLYLSLQTELESRQWIKNKLSTIPSDAINLPQNAKISLESRNIPIESRLINGNVYIVDTEEEACELRKFILNSETTNKRWQMLET